MLDNADNPGSLSPTDVATRTYRVEVACGPFEVGEKFEAWPYGEVFAMISTKGPVCRNAELVEWVKAGKLIQIGGPPLRDPVKKDNAA